VIDTAWQAMASRAIALSFAWRRSERGILMAKLAAVAAAVLLYSPSALTRGGLGHEAICELAFLELDNTGASE
jgi:hypothetical protein